jgi:hypothetical protein
MASCSINHNRRVVETSSTSHHSNKHSYAIPLHPQAKIPLLHSSSTDSQHPSQAPCIIAESTAHHSDIIHSTPFKQTKLCNPPTPASKSPLPHFSSTDSQDPTQAPCIIWHHSHVQVTVQTSTTAQHLNKAVQCPHTRNQRAHSVLHFHSTDTIRVSNPPKNHAASHHSQQIIQTSSTSHHSSFMLLPTERWSAQLCCNAHM